MSFFAQEASSEESREEGPSLFGKLFSFKNIELGGHLKNRLATSRPASDSLFQEIDSETLWDSQIELRLNGRYTFEDSAEFVVHNESFSLISDTQRLLADLEERQGAGSSDFFTAQQSLNDRRRFMDLTWEFEQGKKILFVNRFDRLSLAVFPSWGVFKIGRQAVTWGDGMLFNPFDIFTPFAPTTLDRDYKQGEDAVSIHTNLGDRYGEFQLLYVPRRKVEDRDLRWEESSLAGKYHFSIPETEWDLTFIGGYHFKDVPVGAGIVGYLGGAAWRMNTTWTYLSEESSSFVSLVTNLDYGWVWWGLNFYGWVEYYYNGLGEGRKDYAQALTNDPLRERLVRGEIFVRGRHYLDTQIRVELHPLLNLHLVTINNIVDPSGIVQPYLVWDMHDNVRFNFSATVYWGAPNTEYGGVEIEGTDLTDRPSNNLFAWLTLYF
jgi:hypothetical protein